MDDDIPFDGQARLFPLPNLVLFPQVVQPLHIFEPRYRDMTTDALAGDRRIAMALPQPGWEDDYDGRPALFPIACLGKIVAEQKLNDGRFNLLLRGESRIRIVSELPALEAYRLARVELLDELPMEHAAMEALYRKRLIELATPLFPHGGAVRAEFRKLLEGPMPLGALADVVAFALPLATEFKQELLEELDIAARAKKLIEHLQSKLATKGPHPERAFPPEFSAN
jgi:Lon protease-like protein